MISKIQNVVKVFLHNIASLSLLSYSDSELHMINLKKISRIFVFEKISPSNFVRSRSREKFREIFSFYENFAKIFEKSKNFRETKFFKISQK
jgi:dimeric dUTPase (all-alpha-NTP-PPase superfamily)